MPGLDHLEFSQVTAIAQGGNVNGMTATDDQPGRHAAPEPTEPTKPCASPFRVTVTCDYEPGHAGAVHAARLPDGALIEWIGR